MTGIMIQRFGGAARMTERQPFDVDELVRRNTAGTCFICAYLAGEPGYDHVTVIETATAVVFLNRYPTLEGYVLVAPKAHLVDVTGSFTEEDYVDLQRLIHRVGEAIREVLAPERLYVLSLGSQAANAHVHWHLAPLPPGVPLAEQQYHALMHEHGVVEVAPAEQETYAERVRAVLSRDWPEAVERL